MSDLMSGCLREVDPDPRGAEGPSLLVVKVQVAREPVSLGEEGVRQGAALPVKRVAVAVVAHLPPDLDVRQDVVVWLELERDVCVLLLNVERPPQRLVDQVLGHVLAGTLRVLCHPPCYCTLLPLVNRWSFPKS